MCVPSAAATVLQPAPTVDINPSTRHRTLVQHLRASVLSVCTPQSGRVGIRTSEGQARKGGGGWRVGWGQSADCCSRAAVTEAVGSID